VNPALVAPDVRLRKSCVKLTLYSKPRCHLCEELRALLEDLQPQFAFALEEVDITEDPALFVRYRHDIPVLLADGEELARGRVAERELIAGLKSRMRKAGG
jgi:glutaredoxin